MSSIVAQDFLLATTVLVLDLDQELTSPILPAPPKMAQSGLQLDRPPPSREQITEILREAQVIWYKASKRSHEARKVAEAIKLVLRKANFHDQAAADPSACKSTKAICTLQSRKSIVTRVSSSLCSSRVEVLLLHHDD